MMKGFKRCDQGHFYKEKFAVCPYCPGPKDLNEQPVYIRDHAPFISLIQDGESYSIKVSSQGCFHFWEECILIKKSRDRLILVYDTEEFILKEKDFQRLIRFEEELCLVDIFLHGGCTTKVEYKLTYNSKEHTVSDSSCEWLGFENLKKDLNLGIN